MKALVLARMLLPLLAFWPGRASASNTVTLPKGVFLLDGSLAGTATDVRWDNNRRAQPLITGIDRYEPGGGLQGTITGKPHVVYNILVTQLQYGITDHVTVGLALPVVVDTTIQPNLGWKPGNYQSQLGRTYTETDFWQWAKSMGQNKPGDFRGNEWTPADAVLGFRWRLPDSDLLQRLGVHVALAAQVALPTGKATDPEELVAAGTTAWDLHDYGDAEIHLAAEKQVRMAGQVRLRLGVDTYHAWLRERTFTTPTGVRSPLLLTFAPYAGPTYKIDPGDLDGVFSYLEVVPIIGPSRPTWLARDAAAASRMPPLLMVWAGYTYVHVAQSDWTSRSAWWDWQKEKEWLPGNKNTVKMGAELSLLRVGAPLSLYATYRNQEWLPGRNTRATDVLMVGARLIMKFW